jgi:hypothetical protein
MITARVVRRVNPDTKKTEALLLVTDGDSPERPVTPWDSPMEIARTQKVFASDPQEFLKTVDARGEEQESAPPVIAQKEPSNEEILAGAVSDLMTAVTRISDEIEALTDLIRRQFGIEDPQ